MNDNKSPLDKIKDAVKTVRSTDMDEKNTNPVNETEQVANPSFIENMSQDQEDNIEAAWIDQPKNKVIVIAVLCLMGFGIYANMIVTNVTKDNEFAPNDTPTAIDTSVPAAPLPVEKVAPEVIERLTTSLEIADETNSALSNLNSDFEDSFDIDEVRPDALSIITDDVLVIAAEQVETDDVALTDVSESLQDMKEPEPTVNDAMGDVLGDIPPEFVSADSNESATSSINVNGSLSNNEISQIISLALIPVAQSISDMSHKVDSLISDNQTLKRTVSQLTQKLDSLKDDNNNFIPAPVLGIKSIVAAAQGCDECVDHAFVEFDGGSRQVGEGEMLLGYTVEIKSDALYLISKDTNQKFTYWVGM